MMRRILGHKQLEDVRIFRKEKVKNLHLSSTVEINWLCSGYGEDGKYRHVQFTSKNFNKLAL
jgi:hypothetical protein